MNTFNTISVLGLGYIGLPTAMAFAQSGKRVFGVDINPQVVSRIQALQHNAPDSARLLEPALADAVKAVLANGKLTVSSNVAPADAFVIAVPTPLTATRQPDLSYIQSAAEMIAPQLARGNLIVLESTSPVGTTEQLSRWLAALRPDLSFPTEYGAEADVQIAYCPERVLPTNIMLELFANDRVIGGISPFCTEQAVRFYQIFAKGNCLPTNARTAEMCKLAENSFRDVNIAFANELSMICAEQQIDVWELTRLANHHPRVNILQAGAGVGGHCIAVDPWFIVAQNPDLARLIRTAREVNDYKAEWVIEQVKLAVAECANAQNCAPSALTIACLGLAFKADIDDLRESPALAICQQLSAWHSGKLLAVEPYIEQLPKGLSLPNVALVSAEQALVEADIVVLLVDHHPFKKLTPSQRCVVDTKGIFPKSSRS